MGGGGSRLRPHVLAELMARYKAERKKGKAIMESCEIVGQAMNIPATTVYTAQNRLQPSTDIAADVLRAGAFKLAQRVLRKGNVDQAIDVLSRPNIGVLAPAKESGSSGPAFRIGVQVDALGAISVGVAMGADPQNHADELTDKPMSGALEPSVTSYTDPEPVGRPAQLPPKQAEILPDIPPATGFMGRKLATRLAQRDTAIRAVKSAKEHQRYVSKKSLKKVRAELEAMKNRG